MLSLLTQSVETVAQIQAQLQLRQEHLLRGELYAKGRRH